MKRRKLKNDQVMKIFLTTEHLHVIEPSISLMQIHLLHTYSEISA